MRRWVIAGVVAVVVLAAAGAGAWWLLRPKAKPEPVAAAYLEAWGRKDWAAMQAQVAAPPADFAKRHTDMVDALRVAGASFTPGTAMVTDDRAELPFQAKLELRALGEWPYQGLLRLVRRDDRWLVDWSPATLHPDMAEGQRFQRTRTWPERAPILAADGSELAGPGPVVTVNIVGERVKDPAEVADALEAHAQVPAKVAKQALADAERRPNQAVPVVTMPEADYLAVKDDIHPVPGLSFEAGVGREYNGPASARMLLGSVGPVTADDLTELSTPYQTGDQTGHGNGLEAAFERQLAGTPSGEVRLAGGDGEAAKVLHRFPGEDGQPLETTLDPRVQEAAEAALDSLAKPAALVAVQPSTGELLAVVNSPFHGYNRALLGRYPPGSTFKVVTAGALLESGLRPTDPVDCPKEAKVGGRTFGNFEDEVLGRIPFSSAFAHSCNTAFVQQAAKRLDGDELVAAAAQFGFGLDPSPGTPAVTSRVPPPSDRADLAAESFGQGRVTASPLQMALVAATVTNGRWRHPTLVTGEAPESGGSDGSGSNDSGGAAPAKSPDPLDGKVAGTLRALMRQVVTEGTAAPAGLPGKVGGKTGTAEFGTGDPLPTHAWFIGFRGDLAFSVVVEDGGVGGRVAAPTAARFLRGL
ncbi:MAG TPA: penicillin-binding transpeptidase domain-containing protein [Actinomycetota bacterium]|nr:penicillin-binding transpeptidase domain-containing protein [Actinomycetota bacterium]